MSIRQLSTAGVIAASWVVVGLASPAQAVCDAYSGGCPSTPPTGVPIGGGTDSPGSGNENPGAGNENPGSGGNEEPGSSVGGGTAGGGTAGGGTAGGGSTTGGTTSNPTTLPFTGGELVLMSAIGAGALAGGTALVVAGRRRAHAPA